MACAQVMFGGQRTFGNTLMLQAHKQSRSRAGSLLRIEIALVVCLKSASTAVFIAVSRSATRSARESDLAI